MVLAELNVLNNTNEVNLFDFKNSYISFIAIFFKNIEEDNVNNNKESGIPKFKNSYYKVTDKNILNRLFLLNQD